MADVEAVPVELQACGALLSGIEQDLAEKLKLLGTEVDSLFSGGWQGTAADGFAEGWTQWHEGATKLVSALDTMGKLLAKSGRMYHDTDEDARSAVWRAGESL